MNKQDYIAPKRAVAMADSGAGVPWQELQRWSERQDEGNTEGHHGRGTNSKRAHRRLDFEHVEPGIVVCACMLIVPLFCLPLCWASTCVFELLLFMVCVCASTMQICDCAAHVRHYVCMYVPDKRAAKYKNRMHKFHRKQQCEGTTVTPIIS
jgi:hypothetical protein